MDLEKKASLSEEIKLKEYLSFKRKPKTPNKKRIISSNKANINTNLLKIKTFPLLNIIIAFKFLIIPILFIQIFPNNKLHILQSYLANITLKVRGPGNKYILSPGSYFSTYPTSISINGEKAGEIKNNYDFILDYNEVKLIWNNINLYDCGCMFMGCADITEIDFSDFDTSQVTNIGTIFSGCSSLTSINISKLNTSKVKNMDNIFNGCSSLTSVDLSNFDTSQAIQMNNMFEGCLKLTSLELSHFDTSKVTRMDNMFKGCFNLTYINIKNFNEINLIAGYYSNIFENIPDNAIICLNANNNKNIILSQIQNINCYTIDCTDDWKLKEKKIVNKKGICTDIYNNDINYKY